MSQRRVLLEYSCPACSIDEAHDLRRHAGFRLPGAFWAPRVNPVSQSVAVEKAYSLPTSDECIQGIRLWNTEISHILIPINKFLKCFSNVLLVNGPNLKAYEK